MNDIGSIRSQYRIRQSSGALLAVLAVIAASFVAVAASQQATGQIAALDPALCASTYKPAIATATTRTEADCRTIVAWRNAVVSNPNSVIGANHPMALWGTGSQTEFHRWSGLGVWDFRGHRVVTKIALADKKYMAGPLPGELPYIQSIALQGNLLTGGLPTWIYGAQHLSWLDLRNNRLSGTVTGSAFNTPELVNLLLQHNLFSGPVPNFNFALMPKLTDIRLSNNGFSGQFPQGWSTLENRGMQRLQVAGNYITGPLPSWVSNIKFANSFTPPWIGVGPNKDDFYLSFANNQICLPANFTPAAYKKLDGTNAKVQAFFGGNDCPTGQPDTAFDPPPGEDVKFETVDSSGTPTTTNPVGLKVTWKRPSGIDTSSQLTYAVRLNLIVPRQDNRLPNGNPRYCLPENFDIPLVGPTTDTQNEITITSNNRCAGFDPTKYTASVVSVTQPGATRYAGTSGVTNHWSVYIADDAQKTYRDVAGLLGLDYQGNIWRWDAVNQVWQQRSQLLQDFSTLNLEPGSALAVEKRVLPSWLPVAGLSSADADTPVELQNGWNVISAGGSAARAVYEDGAYFIDENLIDCDSNQGAIAILRHIAGTQRFDIELPCHPARETAITRGQAFRTISEIEELDTLFIYFRSALPVTINWDAANERYTPAS